MRPPPILLLQFLNLLAGGGTYLMICSGQGAWSNAKWTAATVAGVMVATNLCYGGVVAQGGRLADTWGRARTALLGAAVCLGAGLLGALVAHPIAAAAAAMLGFLGTAFFFPGNAGLFSDAGTGADGQQVALHVKVSRYNLGWSSGNVVGFGTGWALSALVPGYGFAVAAGFFALIIGILWRWRSLPPQPPAAAGDRADHPALGRLILTGRVGLLLFCLLGMSVISLLTTTLTNTMSPDEARSVGTAGLTAYALGYVSMFAVLGAWSGWVMRPWRLTLLMLALPVAAAGLLWVGRGGHPSIANVMPCTFLLGLAYGAAYTASLYYSMRLPHGAARAASLHETFLGIGSMIGPLLCAAFLWWQPGLTGLAGYLLVGAAVVLGWQLLMVPGAVARGAR
jgi:hypothetical protein